MIFWCEHLASHHQDSVVLLDKENGNIFICYYTLNASKYKLKIKENFKNQFISSTIQIHQSLLTLVTTNCPFSLPFCTFYDSDVVCKRWDKGGGIRKCSSKPVYFLYNPHPSSSSKYKLLFAKSVANQISLNLEQKLCFNCFEKIISIWISLKFGDKFKHCCW